MRNVSKTEGRLQREVRLDNVCRRCSLQKHSPKELNKWNGCPFLKHKWWLTLVFRYGPDTSVILPQQKSVGYLAKPRTICYNIHISIRNCFRAVRVYPVTQCLRVNAFRHFFCFFCFFVKKHRTLDAEGAGPSPGSVIISYSGSKWATKALRESIHVIGSLGAFFI